MGVIATCGSLCRRSPGQATVEFAFVLIMFLGMAVAMFEGARLVLSYFALSNAAAEGARVGRIVPTTQTGMSDVEMDAKIRTKVREITAFLGTLPDGDIQICRHVNKTTPLETFTPCATTRPPLLKAGEPGGPSVIDVRVRYRFQWIPGSPSPTCDGPGWCAEPLIPRAGINLAGYHRGQLE